MTISMPRASAAGAPGEADAVPFAPVDQRAFREAMSRVGSAVHVLTTDGPAGRAGATVTAVASVSDRPPTVLACVNLGSAANKLVKTNGVFCLSALVADQEPIADAFAGRTGLHGVERFQVGQWASLATGAPALAGARMSLDCRVTEVAEVGTHSVIFGEVVAVSIGPAAPALVYLDRHYRRVD